MFKHIKLVLLVILFPILFGGCTENTPSASPETESPKIGILLVNHGSRSERWREMLLNVERNVKERLLADGRVAAVKTAFMEYTEPSIATQMKAFDAEGIDEVVIVPLFLTVSTHSLDDIPTIVGIKSDPKIVESLGREKIEIYRPDTRVTLAPTLDFTSLLKKNLLRRIQALTPETRDTGIVLVAYGDAHYNQQWEELMGNLGRYLKVKADIDTVAYAWCGHLVDYSPEPTMRAIQQVFELEDKVAVLPLLVAFDPAFQEDIIRKAVNDSEGSRNILYQADAILPDENLERWIVDIVGQTVDRLS